MTAGRTGVGDVVILGCGTLGTALGARLSAGGGPGGARRVIGTTTSPGRVEELRAAGIVPEILELPDPEALACILGGAGAVFLTVAAGRDRSYRDVYLGGARALAEALPGSPVESVVFTSSTAVYGQDDGGWVDESSPTEPRTENGRILLEAERALQEGARSSGVTATVLRLSGLHGPDRGPQRVAPRFSGTTRTGGDSYLNLVHQDDVVEALLLLLERPYDGVLCLSDDHPTTRREYYDRILAELGLPPIRWEPHEGAGGRGRRVRNARIKRELGLELRHPCH